MRLNKLYKQEQGAYSANDLNKSHYLKFNPPIQTQDMGQREIVVELTFNNEIRIVRRTLSNILRISDGSNYSSVLTLFEKGREPKILTTEELLTWLTLGSVDSKSFYTAHMLGQDNIADFLRRTSPESRKALFMKLLQQEELSDWRERLAGYRTPNNILSKKKNAIEETLKKFDNQKQSINSILKNFGYTDILQYISQFRSVYKKLIPFIKSSSLYPNINFDLIKTENGPLVKECIKISQGALQLLGDLRIEKDKFEARKNELNKIQTSIQMLTKLKDAQTMIQKSNHSKRLIGYQFDVLKKEEEDADAAIRLLEEQKHIISKNNKELLKYNSLFDLLSRYFKLNNKDTRAFFDELVQKDQEQFKEWEQFLSQFKTVLNKNKAGLVSIPWDQQLIEELREQDNTLSREISKLKEKLEKHSKEKERFININSQYSEVLIKVKDYIRENIKSINCCPVCLNDNFTSDKYEHLLSEVSEHNVPNDIVSIIDSTISNGSAEIENWIINEKKCLTSYQI